MVSAVNLLGTPLEFYVIIVWILAAMGVAAICENIWADYRKRHPLPKKPNWLIGNIDFRETYLIIEEDIDGKRYWRVEKKSLYEEEASKWRALFTMEEDAVMFLERVVVLARYTIVRLPEEE